MTRGVGFESSTQWRYHLISHFFFSDKLIILLEINSWPERMNMKGLSAEARKVLLEIYIGPNIRDEGICARVFVCCLHFSVLHWRIRFEIPSFFFSKRTRLEPFWV